MLVSIEGGTSQRLAPAVAFTDISHTSYPTTLIPPLLIEQWPTLRPATTTIHLYIYIEREIKQIVITHHFLINHL